LEELKLMEINTKDKVFEVNPDLPATQKINLIFNRVYFEQFKKIKQLFMGITLKNVNFRPKHLKKISKKTDG